MALNIKIGKYKQHPYYEKPTRRDRKAIARVLRHNIKARLKEVS